MGARHLTDNLLLDGMQTAKSSAVSVDYATDSRHDPDNYPRWRVNPLRSYCAGVRFATNNGDYAGILFTGAGMRLRIHMKHPAAWCLW